MAKLSFTAKTVAECENFLKIKWKDEDYTTIDNFIEKYGKLTNDELDTCSIWYRGTENTYKEFIKEYVNFCNGLKFVDFNSFRIIVNESIRASLYFMNKCVDNLQTARFFVMKSMDILDADDNLGWKYGYALQYNFRCTYFGTSATWYSNTFDQLLQTVYWAYELYTSAVDRNGNVYDATWDEKKTMTFCTYEFVVRELKKRGETKVRGLLTSCSGKIEEVRSWANYIKHKGGIDYKYLEPKDPFQIYIVTENRHFELNNFRSPIQIDIDEKRDVLELTHNALYDCITKIIGLIDYDKYQLQLKAGGNENGEDENGID